MGDGRIRGVIPVSEQDKKTFFEKPFEIEDDLMVYEAAMVAAGRHPQPLSVRGPNKGFYLEFLTAGAKSKSRQGARATQCGCVLCAEGRDQTRQGQADEISLPPQRISISSSRESK